MKRVLVTGGLGFVGSHVVDALSADGAFDEVHVLDDCSHNVVEGSASPASYVHYRPPLDLNYDVIVHCAAIADIRFNHLRTEKRAIWETNFVLTRDLVFDAPIRTTFVFLSSGAVYGDRPLDQTPFSRTSPTRPGSLYAASKVAGEALVSCKGFRRWYNLRLPSLVGPRYQHGHVVDFYGQARDLKRIAALDSGLQQKAYRDVRDAAEIIHRLARDEYDVGTYNVGGIPWSVRQTAAFFADVPVSWPENEAGWPGDPLNIQMVDDFGSRFRYGGDISRSIRETIEWLEANE